MICNKCGKDCNVTISTGEPPEVNCCGETYEYVGCYGSYVLDDLVKYTFSVCEGCIAEWMKTFVVPVREVGVNLYHEELGSPAANERERDTKAKLYEAMRIAKTMKGP